ncbi:MAG: nitrilase-related carbon-nitrogen hydrolase [Candidatus Tritonobacter lacicola]|nr:nitrilase-related carbon-nitrogen hydrolase [Candidatus Tritonobacter lacicola]
MKIKASVVQNHCGDCSKQPVNERVKKIIETVDTDVVCLPEIFNTIYFPQYEEPKFRDLAETIPGPTTEEMASVAKAKNIVIVCPLYEKTEEGEHFCSAAVIDADGTIAGVTRKNHIPEGDLCNEGFYFKSGGQNYPVHRTKAGKIGILLCYDRHFPEAARLLGLHGAQIVFIPSATPVVARDIWQLEVRAHAVANGYFAGAANRVGKENKIAYLGNSFFTDPKGNVIAEASEKKEEVVTVEIDMDLIAATRNGWQFYRDRRPETYDSLIK